ncbi:exosome complex RNA-binding protein Csl4 [Candidatus Bathyarchaeota archaeon]|nr:exosome complex RNA-binding protein Csl4 [Candidatus Bathyarchaeota archaeon]
MSKRNIAREEFVVPGSRVGVVEEFTPGKGTYERDGYIYSGITGYASIDPAVKRVEVNPKTKVPILPMEGQNVLGFVVGVQDKIALINIIKVEDKLLSTPFTGILHISSSSPNYERNMSEIFKTLDLVRAKVISTSEGLIRLTTVGRNLGVLKAYCSNCGYPLTITRRLLKCRRCNNVERRKLAEDYLR